MTLSSILGRGGTAAQSGVFHFFAQKQTLYTHFTKRRFVASSNRMAQAVEPKKSQTSPGGVKHGSSGTMTVFDHTLATAPGGDHYDEVRRRLLANPHLRQAPGALGQMNFYDDMSMTPAWFPQLTGGLMPWLPPASALAPAIDSLNELALTTGDMMKKVDFIPRMDVLYDDSKKEIVLVADVPGFDKKDISVSEDDGALVIKGEETKEDKVDQRGPHTRCLMKERRSGYFVRRFQLPKNAVNNGVSATMDKGVLRVNIKLQDTATTKKAITIK